MNRSFPILLGYRSVIEEINLCRQRGGDVLVVAVPWNMVAPHEAQALANHGQSLEQLARRGGLSNCEMLAVLEDRPWRKYEPGHANAILASKITLWREGEIAKLAAASEHDK